MEELCILSTFSGSVAGKHRAMVGRVCPKLRLLGHASLWLVSRGGCGGGGCGVSGDGRGGESKVEEGEGGGRLVLRWKVVEFYCGRALDPTAPEVGPDHKQLPLGWGVTNLGERKGVNIDVDPPGQVPVVLRGLCSVL